MLVEAVQRRHLHVVFTLRADYWGEVLGDSRLVDRLPDPAVIHLRSLGREALARFSHRAGGCSVEW
jgi:hypothetical protein